MLWPLRAARVRFGPTLLSTRKPSVGAKRMKCRSSMMGCFASTTSSSPCAAPAATRRAVQLASSRFSFRETTAPFAVSAPFASALSVASVSHVLFSSVAPNTTRVCPSSPVAIGPGCATHTRTPRSATSPRSEWQNAESAALVALYVAWPGAGHFTAIEPTAVITPSRRASMPGSTAFVSAIALITLISNMSRSTSSVVSSAAACCDPPATWNR
mmetsp:Transcript_8548/g.35744  ORF Transcript_8548/g.35744 Transcript_8548/m.35744 type:complete len:214 (+) Transcript_8548:409-1050(+)